MITLKVLPVLWECGKNTVLGGKCERGDRVPPLLLLVIRPPPLGLWDLEPPGGDVGGVSNKSSPVERLVELCWPISAPLAPETLRLLLLLLPSVLRCWNQRNQNYFFRIGRTILGYVWQTSTSSKHIRPVFVTSRRLTRWGRVTHMIVVKGLNLHLVQRKHFLNIF